MNIGLDIDGVLTNIGDFQIKEGEKFFGKKPINTNGFTIQEMFGCSKKEEEKFWKRKLLKYAITEKAREGANDLTELLHNSGENIIIITSRVYTDKDTKMGKLMRYIVEQWLKSNNIEYDKIIYTSDDKTKVVIENNIDVMIEDNVDNIVNLSKVTNVICMDCSYNKDIDLLDCPRIYSIGKEAYNTIAKIKENIERKKIEDRALNEIKPIFGKASVDRPWLKFYSHSERQTEIPYMTCFDYLYNYNQTNLNKIALNYFGKKITYNELFQKIDECIRSFHSMGVKSGSIVTLCLPNVPEAVYMFYALNKLGAVANMVHPLKSSEEIKDCINAVNSDLLVMIDNSYEEINRIIDETNVKNAVVVSAGDSMPFGMGLVYKLTSKMNIDYTDNSKYMKLSEFMKLGKNVDNFLIPIYQKDITAVIMYTGGTSGDPKGVELTNDNYNCMVHQQRATAKNFYTGDTMLTIMPVFHGFGLCSSIHMPLSYGITTILVPKYNSKDFHELIQKYKPNHIFGIPKLWEAFINDEHIKNMDLSFLRYVVSGGEQLKESLEENINEFLFEHNSASKVKKGYGSTEGVAGLTLSDDYCNKIGSIGIPLLWNNFKIVKPGTEEELDYNQEGEFCVNGPTVMKGYFNNIEETEACLKRHSDGKLWLHTGDMGYMTEDGLLYYTDRLTRMYVSSGINIYPPRIEKVIEQNDKVELCAVVPINHPEKNIKVPKAYIILKEGYEMDEELTHEIMECCKTNLDKYHQPYIYEQVNEFPITKLEQELGKVDYKELERQANSSKVMVRKAD